MFKIFACVTWTPPEGEYIFRFSPEVLATFPPPSGLHRIFRLYCLPTDSDKTLFLFIFLEIPVKLDSVNHSDFLFCSSPIVLAHFSVPVFLFFVYRNVFTHKGYLLCVMYIACNFPKLCVFQKGLFLTLRSLKLMSRCLLFIV